MHERRAGLVDTTAEIVAILTDGYRRMSPQQKLERVRAMTQAVQQLAVLDIRRRYPGATEYEIRLRLASRWLPAETMRQAFEWDPDREGR